ncbi:hypothetical protein RS130_22485 [Paraglaciecola aquimarina]|uniref:PEP-CTERM protein-sorting domain-containing protein n=1 Tax=Paraglaciecola aquimarina TaxID=1235557 RepID=A0ABU3T1Z4_9ALTE|nr:hypothetical protein [Paraglaciecola aquimarina]MDU0356284.1 hypothetical protein [Paraglaciecola aquimarina]
MRLSRWLLMLPMILPIGVAQAIVIPTGVSVEGTVHFDDLGSYVDLTTQNDGMGAGSTSSAITDANVTGDNPISSQLTDPLFIRSSLSAENLDIDFEFVSYFFEVTLENNLANTTEFFFTFSYSQQADATANDSVGGDAFVDSNIELEDELGSSLVSSYLASNLNDGLQIFTDSLDFSFVVGASEQLTFSGLVDLVTYSYDVSEFSLVTDVSLALTKVETRATDVPEPAVWSFFLLAGMLMMRNRICEK